MASITFTNKTKGTAFWKSGTGIIVFVLTSLANFAVLFAEFCHFKHAPLTQIIEYTTQSLEFKKNSIFFQRWMRLPRNIYRSQVRSPLL